MASNLLSPRMEQKPETMDSLNYQSKKPRVVWNPSKQALVCCLFRFFHRDGNAFRKIFTSIFKHDLNHFDGDVPFATLSTQWHHLKRFGDPIWHEVNIEVPFPPPEGPWLALIVQIKEKAAAMGVPLVEKEEDDVDTTNFSLDPSRRSRNRPTPSQTPVVTPASIRTVDTQSSLPLQPATVTRPTESEPLCTAGGKICYWCCQEAVEDNGQNQRRPEADKDLPPLLYRWSNVESQGVNSKDLVLSGLFSNTEKRFFGPEEIPRSDFDEFFTNHVSIVKSSSPFISTFKSLLAPLHRALRAREGAIVSIVDSSKLQTEAYSAQRVVRELNINISGYRGVGEYLIWGKIPTPAIVCSFTISNLVRIAEKDKEIWRLLQLDQIESSQRNRGKLHRTLSQGPGNADHRSGRTVGRLLAMLNLPSPNIEGVAMGLSYSWRFKKNGTLEEYLKGLKEGYLAPMMVPTTPETPSSPPQPDIVIGEEADDSLAMSEEEGDGDDDIVPTIESPCPAPREQHGAPRVEFFDPRAQRWSETANGVEGQNSEPTDMETPLNSITQDGDIDQSRDDMEMDVLIDELMNLTE